MKPGTVEIYWRRDNAASVTIRGRNPRRVTSASLNRLFETAIRAGWKRYDYPRGQEPQETYFEHTEAQS